MATYAPVFAVAFLGEAALPTVVFAARTTWQAFEYERKLFSRSLEYWLHILPNSKKIKSFDRENDKLDKLDYKLKPIFIIGFPRCGSTLVEKIIASGAEYIPMGEETGVITTFLNQKLLKKQSLDFEI